MRNHKASFRWQNIRCDKKTGLLALTLCAILCPAIAQAEERRSAGPILLADVDHRATVSLDGDWHAIVDPYATGLYDFHGRLRANGFFKNEKQGGGGPVEYDFQKSPTLRVPGDWNTQRDSLFFYEGPVWYEKDFDYHPKARTRVFFHVGAANYRSHVWVNGEKVCEHEGGFTPFDCEITRTIREGSNFAVVAVDSTRAANGLPTLETDWWNYGGLTRDVSLVEVPQSFVDDYSFALRAGTKTEIEGWVHVDGGQVGAPVAISLPELQLAQTATMEEDGRAKFHLSFGHLELWSPEHPRLYRVQMRAGEDLLEDEIGFRMIEIRGTHILLNGEPIFLRGVSIHAEAPYRTGRAYSAEDARTLMEWVKGLNANYARLAHYPHDERCADWRTGWESCFGLRFRFTGRYGSRILRCSRKPSSSWPK